MKLKFTFLIFLPTFLFFSSFAQFKVSIMGSSTAYGVGASVYDSSWAGRTAAYLNQNSFDGADTIVNNVAFPAYDTYQEMPTGFVPPVGRPTPDEDYNVTKALSFNPSVVIINLPSNDINYGYAKSEMMSNLRLMFSTVTATGARCYVATPQPRNDLSDAFRDSLRTLVDSVQLTFGPYALDFWNGLVTTDGTNMLQQQLAATGSPLHVNDDGHELLFERVREMFANFAPVALQLTNFSAQAHENTVSVTWHTEAQRANTTFEIQRSTDGQNFSTAFTQTYPEASQSRNYGGTDQTPFAGKSFYRIKTIEPGRISYSFIVSVNRLVKTLSISNLYFSSASALTVTISTQKSQSADYSIINSAGAVIMQKKIFTTVPGASVDIPVSNLPSGQYYFRISGENGVESIKAFSK